MEQNNNRPRFSFQRPPLNKEPISKSAVTEKPSSPQETEVAPPTPRAKSPRVNPEKSERAKTSVASSPSIEDHDFEGLMERHRELVRQRDQLTYQKDEAARKLAACVAEAKRLGINSLEEMREKIAELQAIDKAAKESFAKNLDAEDQLQSHIAEQLKNIDNE